MIASVFVFLETFFWGARRLSTPQEHKHSLIGAVGKVGVAGPGGAPNTELQADVFSHLPSLCANTWVLQMELGGS